MTENSSLWQLYESSEAILWRRGRIVLVCLGAFYFLAQALLFAAEITAGVIEPLFVMGTSAVLFWILFYLVWIGFHWIRWVWGGLNLMAGFFLLIWAWRDQNGFETLCAVIGLIIGSYLCLAPSVYSFAIHQRETVRWKEALLVGGIGFLILLSLAAGMFGLYGYRLQQWEVARGFVGEASEQVFVARNYDWLLSHLTQHTFQQQGAERLKYFLTDAQRRLGQVKSIQPAHGIVRLRFQFPARLGGEAAFVCEADSDWGPVELDFLLHDTGEGWQIEHLRWEYR